MNIVFDDRKKNRTSALKYSIKCLHFILKVGRVGGFDA